MLLWDSTGLRSNLRLHHIIGESNLNNLSESTRLEEYILLSMLIWALLHCDTLVVEVGLHTRNFKTWMLVHLGITIRPRNNRRLPEKFIPEKFVVGIWNFNNFVSRLKRFWRTSLDFYPLLTKSWGRRYI